SRVGARWCLQVWVCVCYRSWTCVCACVCVCVSVSGCLCGCVGVPDDDVMALEAAQLLCAAAYFGCCFVRDSCVSVCVCVCVCVCVREDEGVCIYVCVSL